MLQWKDPFLRSLPPAEKSNCGLKWNEREKRERKKKICIFLISSAPGAKFRGLAEPTALQSKGAQAILKKVV